VNPGMTVEQALGALVHLQNLRTGHTRVRYSCTDSTGSDLCRTSKAIRRELARLPAWAVTRKDGEHRDLARTARADRHGSSIFRDIARSDPRGSPHPGSVLISAATNSQCACVSRLC
jgi:hypothetical protein